MGLERTLAEIRTDVRDKGGYHRSAVFTNTKLNRWINEAARELYDLLIHGRGEDYYTISSALTTINGQDYLPLPSDFFKLMGLFLRTGDRKVPLVRSTLREMVSHTDIFVGNYTRSYLYRMQADRVYFSPTPTGADTLDIYYIPQLAELVDDTDTFKTIHGYDTLIEAKVLLRCARRDRNAAARQEWELEVTEKTKEITSSSAGRDSNEPPLLGDNSRGAIY